MDGSHQESQLWNVNCSQIVLCIYCYMKRCHRLGQLCYVDKVLSTMKLHVCQWNQSILVSCMALLEMCCVACNMNMDEGVYKMRNTFSLVA